MRLRTHFRYSVILLSTAFTVAAPTYFARDLESTPDHRLRSAHDSFHEVMEEPDKGIPLDLFNKAECIVISETCRRHGIAPNLFYRWKDEAEQGAKQGAKAALGGRSAAVAETEKDHRIRQLERTLGRKSLEIEILKNVVGE